jgi:hypothetical protein
MPGKTIKPELASDSTNGKASVSEVDAISALKAVREHQHVRDIIMKSAKWKKKQESVKGGPKAPRYSEGRPQVVRGWELRVDDDGEDVAETDWVAAVENTDRPEVHEVPLVDLLQLKPGKQRQRSLPGTLSVPFRLRACHIYTHVRAVDDFEVVGVASVIALDDQLVPEPEAVEEDWEPLDLDDDGETREASNTLSYAEAAAAKR